MKVIIKLMTALFIIQERRVKRGNKRIRYYENQHKLNPYNPLSYLTILIVVLFGFIMFGVVGFKKGVDCRNPFIWKQ
jgi:predicted PurR-regulated permease PerM